MATPFKNLQQVLGALIEKGERDDIMRNDSITGDEKPNIEMDQLRKKFHKSLDINHSTQLELNDQSCLSIDYQVNYEIEATAKETKKRSISETTENENETRIGLDLELKLSPPGSNVSENTSNPLKSSSSWISLSASSPSSQGTCISSNNLDSDENLGWTSKDELPPLIVMGCTRCFLYVMASKSDPKCPKCKNPNLLDVAENAAKRSRTSPN